MNNLEKLISDIILENDLDRYEIKDLSYLLAYTVVNDTIALPYSEEILSICMNPILFLSLINYDISDYFIKDVKRHSDTLIIKLGHVGTEIPHELESCQIPNIKNPIPFIPSKSESEDEINGKLLLESINKQIDGNDFKVYQSKALGHILKIDISLLLKDDIFESYFSYKPCVINALGALEEEISDADIDLSMTIGEMCTQSISGNTYISFSIFISDEILSLKRIEDAMIKLNELFSDAEDIQDVISKYSNPKVVNLDTYKRNKGGR